MRLRSLLEKSGIPSSLATDPEITGLSYDSRKVKPGDLFFAIPGHHVDGYEFIKEATQKGAVAHIMEKPNSSVATGIVVPSVMGALSRLAHEFYDRPSEKIPVIGVTGTNGKTTTTFLIENILRRFGKTCGVMGTINYRIGSLEWAAPNTTPMALDIHAFLSEAIQKKATAVAMEVSSHAIELKRVEDVHFSHRVFTNLTQDHLDFHITMEAYYQAKAKLFHRKERGKAIINIDDTYGVRLAREVEGCVTYGFDKRARMFADEYWCRLSGVEFKLHFPSGKVIPIRSNLLGKHNILNLLAAAGTLWSMGFTELEIADGLSREQRIPGRLERVEMGQSFVVAVDYAHTDDALAQVLKTLRETGPRKLYCVFGAGGDRDKTKRPKMGAVAVNLADFSYVTSDNPRTENPAAILKDIEVGIHSTGKSNYELIEDRTQAIEKAIKQCTSGDILLIAGKGHEDYQIIGQKKFPFSDFEVAKKALSQ